MCSLNICLESDYQEPKLATDMIFLIDVIAEDINKVADFVDEGARLVVKVADEIEEIAHAADLSAQEAEDLALKVEAKTKLVKETLDAIADVLEGDKKLSTVLTDYANMKKETTETTKGSGSSNK